MTFSTLLEDGTTLNFKVAHTFVEERLSFRTYSLYLSGSSLSDGVELLRKFVPVSKRSAWVVKSKERKLVHSEFETSNFSTRADDKPAFNLTCCARREFFPLKIVIFFSVSSI